MTYVCTLRRLQPRPAMVVRREVPLADAAPAMIAGFRTIAAFLAHAGATPAGETYARYLEIGPERLTVEIGFTVHAPLAAADPIQPSELPGGEAVVTLHRGRYERLPEAVAALEQWLREHGRDAAGPHWEVYLNGPPIVTDPDRFETEVYIPLLSP